MEKTINVSLTEEQGRAIADQQGRPLRLVDPGTNRVFVLLSADEYERVRSLLDDDFDVRDAYPAQIAAAMRAGWDDPEMSDYDNYDEVYRKQCQSTVVKSS